jgi:hypothetical protein
VGKKFKYYKIDLPCQDQLLIRITCAHASGAPSYSVYFLEEKTFLLMNTERKKKKIMAQNK